MSKVFWQYTGICLVWGASYLFMRVASEGLTAGHIVVARLVMGATALAVCMRLAGKQWPRDRVYWAHLTVIAVSACLAPHLFLAWASQDMPSALMSVCTSVTPLLTVLLTVGAFRQERVTAGAVAGVAIGALGIMLVLSPWSEHAGGSRGGYLACIAASACYAVSFVYTRRFITPHGRDAVSTAAGQIAAAALLAVAVSPMIAADAVHLTSPVVAAMVCLGVLGTGISYIWYQAVINTWGATTASTVTYVMPVVGAVLGVLVLGERLSWNQAVGGIVVIVGVLLGPMTALVRARLRPR